MTTDEGDFRKKPVVVQAIRYDSTRPLDVMLRWVPQVNGGRVAEFRTDGERLIISTLEGDMAAEPGDWIIRGVKGEFYPCKPDIFEATYEAAGAFSNGEPQP